MGSSRRQRKYKPRGGSRRASSQSRRSHTNGSSWHDRDYKPRRRNSAFNRFQNPRHHRNNPQFRQHNNLHHGGPVPQGDGTWYDPETGEYFRKETLFEMLKRWFSLSGSKKS